MDDAEPVVEEDFAKSFSFLADTRSCLSSPELRRSLRTARTWVLTLAVIASCWLGLSCVLVLLGTFATQGFGSAEMMGFVFMFSVMAVVLGIPVALMFQFAARTRRFIATGNLRNMRSLLQAQRWMWTVLGIYGLILIFLNAVTLMFPASRIKL